MPPRSTTRDRQTDGVHYPLHVARMAEHRITAPVDHQIRTMPHFTQSRRGFAGRLERQYRRAMAQRGRRINNTSKLIRQFANCPLTISTGTRQAKEQWQFRGSQQLSSRRHGIRQSGRSPGNLCHCTVVRHRRSPKPLVRQNTARLDTGDTPIPNFNSQIIADTAATSTGDGSQQRVARIAHGAGTSVNSQFSREFGNAASAAV